MPLQSGDKFPEGVVFDWAPINSDDPTVCGLPTIYNASKEWKGKKVVLISIPGAFTPSCSAYHLPPYVEKFDELKKKGVDIVAFIMINDPFVTSAWGRANKVPIGDEFVLLSDTKTHFSKQFGWMAGDRTGRYGMIIEKDGIVSYAENEKHLQAVEASSFDTISVKV